MNKESQDKGMVILDDLLSNTHHSLKWSWQIVMGFAMVSAVQGTYSELVPVLQNYSVVAGTVPNNFDLIKSSFSLLLFAFVFIPTFVRFYYGDNRYLDLHYLELTKLAEYKPQEQYIAELQNFGALRRLFDILLLLTHGVFFIFLGKSINEPEIFVLLYAFLMLTNVIWLYKSVNSNQVIESEDDVKSSKRDESLLNITGPIERVLIRYPSRDHAPKFWIRNNLYSLIGFVPLFFIFKNNYISLSIYILISIVIFAINSIRDFYGTWHFYFPNLCNIYLTAKESENEKE